MTILKLVSVALGIAAYVAAHFIPEYASELGAAGGALIFGPAVKSSGLKR